MLSLPGSGRIELQNHKQTEKHTGITTYGLNCSRGSADRINLFLLMTKLVIFMTNPVILRTNPVIFKTSSVIFRTNPIIFTTHSVVYRTNLVKH